MIAKPRPRCTGRFTASFPPLRQTSFADAPDFSRGAGLVAAQRLKAAFILAELRRRLARRKRVK
jgi:hypothetical protein